MRSSVVYAFAGPFAQRVQFDALANGYMAVVQVYASPLRLALPALGLASLSAANFIWSHCSVPVGAHM